MTTEASLDIFWRGESWRIRKANGVFTDPEDFLPRLAPEVKDERSGIAGTVCGKLPLDCETIKPGNMMKYGNCKIGWLLASGSSAAKDSSCGSCNWHFKTLWVIAFRDVACFFTFFVCLFFALYLLYILHQRSVFSTVFMADVPQRPSGSKEKTCAERRTSGTLLEISTSSFDDVWWFPRNLDF